MRIGGMRAKVHPSVSGMGMGAMDTAAGLACLSLWKSALDKSLAAKLTPCLIQQFCYWVQTKAPDS